MNIKMNLDNSIKICLRDFINKIADHYNINHSELEKLLVGNKKMKCLHIMTNGKNKGSSCTATALENGYCAKHQGDTIPKESFTKEKSSVSGMTKTQLKIIELLNTAVPQKETILKRIKDRPGKYINEETELLFNKELVVEGKLINDTVYELSEFDIELCERYGWRYLESAIKDDPEN